MVPVPLVQWIRGRSASPFVLFSNIFNTTPPSARPPPLFVQFDSKEEILIRTMTTRTRSRRTHDNEDNSELGLSPSQRANYSRGRPPAIVSSAYRENAPRNRRGSGVTGTTRRASTRRRRRSSLATPTTRPHDTGDHHDCGRGSRTPSSGRREPNARGFRSTDGQHVGDSAQSKGGEVAEWKKPL